MGLIAHYRMDDLSASIGPDLVYKNNGGKLTQVQGLFGGAYARSNFADGNDYLEAIEDIYLPSSFTFACWAYVTAAGSSANGLVTNHSHSNQTGSGITVKYVSDDDYRISCNTGTGSSRTYHTYYGTSNIKDRWAHLVVRYDAPTSMFSLWVDGVKEREFSYSQYNRPDKLQLFSWSTTHTSNASYRTGAVIDDVRIYDHALSPREVRDLSLGLVLDLRFIGDGDLTDSSGQGVGAQISTGTPAWESGKYVFSGGDSLDIPEDDRLNFTDEGFTLCFRAATYSGVTSNARLFSRGSYFGAGYEVFLDSSSLQFRSYDGSSHAVIASVPDTTELADYVVVKYPSQGATIYRDGEPIAENTSIPSPLPYSGNTIIGRYSSGYYLTGEIHFIKAYATALTAAQVKELYQQRASIDSEGSVHTPMLSAASTWKEAIGAHNLLENGYGELGNNQNFSALTYEPEGHFSVKGNNNGAFSNRAVPVIGNGLDTFDVYEIRCQAKAEVEESRMYFLLRCRDVNMKRIAIHEVSYYPGTQAVLTQDLLDGDTWVNLDDVSGWVDDGDPNSNSATKFLALWHSDADGEPYVAYKYSRRTVRYASVDAANNRIVLQSPWSGGTIPSGSAAQNHRSGSTYSYIGASNSLLSLSEWRTYSGSAGGTASVDGLRFGTSYVEVGWLLNRSASNPTTLLKEISLVNKTREQREVFTSNQTKMVESGVSTFDTSEVGITRGLVAWYPLDGDDTDLANNSTVSSALSTGYATEGGNTGANFDTTDTLVYSLVDSIPVGDPWTFGCSVYFRDFSSSSNYPIFITDSLPYLAVTSSGGSLRCRYRGPSGQVNASSSASLTAGKWHDVRATFDPFEGVKLFLDGSQVGHNPDPSTSSFGGIRVGGHGSSYMINGIIRDVRIHNVALTPEEVAIQAKLALNPETKSVMTPSCLYTKGQIKEVIA